MAVAVHLEQPLLALESAWYLWLAAVQPPPVSASLPVFRWCVESTVLTRELLLHRVSLRRFRFV